MGAEDIAGLASASKPDLIGRFMKAAGVQEEIDQGRVLDQLAWPGGAVYKTAMSALGPWRAREAALAAARAAYEKHRPAWQKDYEEHLDREFSEEELRDIVAFLETPAGQHFLKPRWQLEAWIQIEGEALIEPIARDAQAEFAAR